MQAINLNFSLHSFFIELNYYMVNYNLYPIKRYHSLVKLAELSIKSSFIVFKSNDNHKF